MAELSSQRSPTQDELVDQLAEEFADCLRKGQPASISEYAQKYPQVADQIQDLFPALVVLEGKPKNELDENAAGSTIQLKDYRILRELGRGGMGIVYEAEQISLGRKVALKVISPHLSRDPRCLIRFRREAKAAGSLHHTNIVPVFDVGQTEACAYYVMQLIEGQSLDRIICELKEVLANTDGDLGNEERELRQASSPAGLASRLLSDPSQLLQCSAVGPQPETETRKAIGFKKQTPEPFHKSSYFQSVASIGLQAAEALAFAHQKGIIHRDIKPANLILDSSLGVWITDFGLARLEDDSLTQSQELVGTLRYLAPERLEGCCTALSDVYSLGATLYELLALRPAFPANDRIQLIHDVRNFSPPPLNRIDAQIPVDLQTIVERAMAREPERRYADAGALREDLRRYLSNEPIVAKRSSNLEKLIDWSRSNRLLASLTLVLLLGLVAVAIGSTVSAVVFLNQKNRAEHFQKEAEQRELDRKYREWESYLASANGWRQSRAPGQRFESLKSIQAALALPVPIGHSHTELQTEAIGALTLADLQPAQKFPTSPEEQIYGINDDFSLMAVGLHSGEVEVRSVKDATCVASLPNIGLNDVYSSIRFSRKGELVLHRSSQHPRLCQIWRISADRNEFVFEKRGVDSADFSPDGRQVAFWVGRNLVEICDSQSGHCQRTIEVPEDVVPGSIHWNPRRNCLALGTTLLDLDTGKFESLPLKNRFPNCVDWHPLGVELALCYDPGTVEFWNTLTKQRSRNSIRERLVGGIIARYSQTGDNLLISDWSFGLRLYELKSGVQRIASPDCMGTAILAFSADDSLIGVDTTPGMTRLFRLCSGDEMHTFSVGSEQLAGPMTTAPGNWCSSPSGKFAAVTSWDGLTRLVDWTNRRSIQIQSRDWSEWGGVEIPGNALAFTAQGNLLTLGEMGVVEWSLDLTGTTIRIGNPRILIQETGIAHVALHQESGLMALARYAQPTLIFKLENGQCTQLRELDSQPDVRFVVFDPSGRFLATGSHGTGLGNCVRVFEVPTFKTVMESSMASLSQLDYSENGQWLFAGGPQPHLWRTRDWSQPLLEELHDNTFAACFSDDNRLIALQDRPGFVRLIDLQQGFLLARLALPEPALYMPTRLSKSGQLFLQLSQTNRAAVLDLPLIQKGLVQLGLGWHDTGYFSSREEDVEPLCCELLNSPLREEWTQRIWLREAQAKQDSNRIKEAIELYRKVINGGRFSASTLNEFSLLLSNGSHEYRNPLEARQLAKEAVSLEPDKAAFWSTLGIAEFHCGHWEVALESFETSNQLGHDHVGSNGYFQSVCYRQLGEFGLAADAYFRAEQHLADQEKAGIRLAFDLMQIREQAWQELTQPARKLADRPR